MLRYQRYGTIDSKPLKADLERYQPIPGGAIIQLAIHPIIPEFFGGSNWYWNFFQHSTKAAPGERGENITREQARNIVGDEYTDKIEQFALKIYNTASGCAVRYY